MKNPWDLPYFLTIKKLIPNAKFIFIHRNPYKTLSSFNKAVKLIIKKENFYTSMIYTKYKKTIKNPLLKNLSRLIYSEYMPFGTINLISIDKKAVKYYIKNISKIPKKDYVEITYENLCIKPNETVKQILDYLNIRTEKIDFSVYIKQREASIDHNVKLLKSFVYKKMKEYFKKFNYSSSI